MFYLIMLNEFQAGDIINHLQSGQKIRLIRRRVLPHSMHAEYLCEVVSADTPIHFMK